MAKPLKRVNRLFGAGRTKDVNVLRMAAAASDAETVTIGDETFEVSLLEATGDITSGNVEVNLFDDATQSQGTLTVAVNPTADDTMTIGSTVYTFKATASVAGEITIGGSAAATQANIVAAINGSDGLNTAHPLVTIAAFAANDAVITATKAGVGGDAIATTETFTSGSNVFDAATLGTTTAGADPTAEEFIDGFLTVVNASSTSVTAVKLGAAALLIVAREDGPRAIACTETLAGTNNGFAAAATYGGRQVNGDDIKRNSIESRVPNAGEVATGFMVFGFPFPVSHAVVQVKTTSTNAVVAWDGDVNPSGNNVIITNDGSTDWATTSTVTVIAGE